MSGPKKLQALLTGCQAAEEEAKLKRVKVERVAEAREKSLTQCEEKRKALQQKRTLLLRKRRSTALQSGDLAQVSSLTRYGKRLEQELKKLEKSLEERKKEYKRAQIHVKLAEEEELEARIERKKVEQLLSKTAQQKLFSDVAREEIMIDEFNNMRRKG